MNDRMPDGTPFHVVEAEREFIGAALLSEFDDVIDITLDRNDFHDRSLGAIWAACQEGARRGSPGIVMTACLLERAGVLDQVGSETRLMELMGKVFVEHEYPHVFLTTHPPIISDWAQRRRGVAAAAEVAYRAYSGRHPRSTGIPVESVFSE